MAKKYHVTREEAIDIFNGLKKDESFVVSGASILAYEALKREQKMIEAAKEGKQMEFFIGSKKFVCREVE